MTAGGRMRLALSLEGLLTEGFRTGLDVGRLRPFPGEDELDRNAHA